MKRLGGKRDKWVETERVNRLLNDGFEDTVDYCTSAIGTVAEYALTESSKAFILRHALIPISEMKDSEILRFDRLKKHIKECVAFYTDNEGFICSKTGGKVNFLSDEQKEELKKAKYKIKTKSREIKRKPSKTPLSLCERDELVLGYIEMNLTYSSDLAICEKSNIEIGKQVGMSSSKVSKALKKLLSMGIISYKAEMVNSVRRRSSPITLLQNHQIPSAK